MTSSSEESMRCASNPGTILKSSRNTSSSFHSLKFEVNDWLSTEKSWMHITESDSISGSSAIFNIPLVTKVCMLKKEWTARPKWWPWWTNGFCVNLKYGEAKPRAITKYFQFLPWSKLQSTGIGTLLCSWQVGSRVILMLRVPCHQGLGRLESDNVSQKGAYLYLVQESLGKIAIYKFYHIQWSCSGLGKKKSTKY